MKSKKEVLEVIELLKAVSQFIGDSRTKLCAPYGLSHIQAIIILDIYHHLNATKITDICKRLHKSTSTISPLINRLIEKGFLEKRQNQIDNRIFEVYLTEYGQQILNKINEDVLAFAEPIFAEFTDESFQNLKESLNTMSRICGLL